MKIARTQTKKYIVSTVLTSDEGYETAIIDNRNAIPVSRYKTKKEAILGHEEWVKNIDDLLCVNRLGWLGCLVEEKIVILIPIVE